MARADKEKADFDKLLSEVLEGSEQHIIRLNVAIIGHNWAKKLTRTFVTELVSVVDAVLQQLSHDVVSWRLLGLERSYRLYKCRVWWF